MQRDSHQRMELGKGQLPDRRTEEEEKTVEEVPRQVADSRVSVQYHL